MGAPTKGTFEILSKDKTFITFRAAYWDWELQRYYWDTAKCYRRQPANTEGQRQAGLLFERGNCSSSVSYFSKLKAQTVPVTWDGFNPEDL